MANRSLLRQWAMLNVIPRHPKTATSNEIWGRITELSHSVSERTVQRDLIELSTIFPITCTEDGRSNRWYWPQKINSQQLPPPDLSTSLALHLAEQHLNPLLPPALLELLSPLFTAAEQVIDNASDPNLAAWPDKVEVISSRPPLLPAKISAEVQRVVFEAIFRSKKVALSYRPKSRDHISKYEVSPLGIISRDGVIYIVVSMYQKPFQLALHRIQSAATTEEKISPPDHFVFKEYIEELKTFSKHAQPEYIALKLRMHAGAVEHLAERPLATDQKITDAGEGKKIVTATVLHTAELKWWLLGFGRNVEVLQPRSLRKSFATIAKDMHQSYINNER